MAVQLDAESGANATVCAQLRNAGLRVHGWQARPNGVGVATARGWGCEGYIGQAESEAEALACLALEEDDQGNYVKPLSCPKAVVGNPSAWSSKTFDKLASRGWQLLLEWYWNAHPWESGPNAANYPWFVSVVFGCYDASGEQSTGRRVALASYRSVWKGDWCVYLAETMTEDDWRAS